MSGAIAKTGSVDNPLSLNDLAAAGIGFDIAGALLLAKGLLVSPKEQLKRNASGWGGYSFYQVIGWSEDWIDAVAGGASLTTGFVFQVVSYALVTGGLHARTGFGAAFGVIGFAVLAGILSVAVWDSIRRSLVRSRIIGVARATSRDGRPDGYLLAGIARELVGPFEKDQLAETLASVFGVEDYVIEHEDQLEKTV